MFSSCSLFSCTADVGPPEPLLIQSGLQSTKQFSSRSVTVQSEEDLPCPGLGMIQSSPNLVLIKAGYSTRGAVMRCMLYVIYAEAEGCCVLYGRQRVNCTQGVPERE